ncbi:hypothetical protein Q4Q35_03865 [Flavivirga aquimarina]|uniref:Uncharacterized protein n=1 Tax=Flavivirga aquimarina TaxID=2027862 RepID=A0ABT8W779_9FLAO|nr:hypothetical protein [Flavivirga aquimarina]MDO5968934.1 hypothetical protein [Flavivirga aquimarina]
MLTIKKITKKSTKTILDISNGVRYSIGEDSKGYENINYWNEEDNIDINVTDDNNIYTLICHNTSVIVTYFKN